MMLPLGRSVKPSGVYTGDSVVTVSTGKSPDAPGRGRSSAGDAVGAALGAGVSGAGVGVAVGGTVGGE